MRLWVAYILVFVLVLLTCTLLARMLRALISATPLSFVDRLLGGVFGVVRGALILVVVGTLVTLSPYADVHDVEELARRALVGPGAGRVETHPSAVT